MQEYTLDNFKAGGGPREKLLEYGPDVLTEAELLAIIFITGNRNENVLELSNRILKEYGSRSITNVRDVEQLTEQFGLGNSKASQLIAIFELGRRFYSEQSSRMPQIKGPEDVFGLFSNMQKLNKEELRAIYLNSRKRIIREELISLGNENMNIVTPKEIIQPAVELLAKGIIIVHNHPSGHAYPSDEDIKFTRRLEEACEIIGIELIDHIIIGKNKHISLKMEKII